MENNEGQRERERERERESCQGFFRGVIEFLDAKVDDGIQTSDLHTYIGCCDITKFTAYVIVFIRVT